MLDHLDQLEESKEELVPQDGWLLEPTEVSFAEGESVFDLLQRTCREEDIHMEFSITPMLGSAYVEGIGNLYEFDCGDLSGWVYAVNGVSPNTSASDCLLRDGDAVEWRYTCDLGGDVDAAWAE